MANTVIDLALGKMSTKYPNFSAEGGRKVVDSIQEAYKSFQNKRKLNAEVKSPPESHSLIDVPSDSGPTKASSSNLSNRDSMYENCEDFMDQLDTPEVSGKKFPLEQNGASTSLANGSGTSDASYHKLSENPPSLATTAIGEDGEKKDLAFLPPQSSVQGGGAVGAAKPPDAPNISQYLQKKSMAQGMMDLALLSANTNQLRYILDSRDENSYFSVGLTLILTSLVLQVVVGLMLVWNSQYNVQRRSGFASADRINNLSVFGVFLITLINVFVSTFGNVPSGASHPPTSTSTVAPAAGGVESTSAVAIPVEEVQLAAIGE